MKGETKTRMTQMAVTSFGEKHRRQLDSPGLNRSGIDDVGHGYFYQKRKHRDRLVSQARPNMGMVV